MKLFSSLVVAAGIVVLGCGFSSCQTLGNFVKSKPVVTYVTNTIPGHVEYRTNVIVQPPRIVIVTNTLPAQPVYVTNTVAGEPVVFTNFIPGPTVFQTITNTLPPLVVTNEVYVPITNVVVIETNGFEANPQLLAAIQKGQQLNAAFNPTPSAPIVNGVLAVLGAIATVVAGYQTNKLKREKDNHEETKGTLAIAQDAGKTLVENFETLRQAALQVPGYTPEIDHRIMDVVKTAQALAGAEVKTAIHDLVEEHTGDTIPSK